MNKNIFHVWSLLCFRSIVDQETNSFSIIDVLEKITINKKEEKKLDNMIFDLVTLIFRDNITSEEEGILVAELFDPSKKAIAEFEQKFVVKKDIKRVRLRLRISGSHLNKGAGRYMLQIRLKENNKEDAPIVSQIPLDLEFIKK